MASNPNNLAVRTMARIRSLIGVNTVQNMPVQPGTVAPAPSVHFGSFSENEFRHMDSMIQRLQVKNRQSNGVNGLDSYGVTTYLSNVASSTRKHIDEIKNLKILAPEIDQAAMIIISSMISPIDLQTDAVTVKVDCDAIPKAMNAKITDYLTTFFNKEYKLGGKLFNWLKKAGFEDGATALLVLPKHQIDVLNTVADKWRAEELTEYKRLMSELSGSSESLESFMDKKLGSKGSDKVHAVVETFAEQLLDDAEIGLEYLEDGGVEWAKVNQIAKDDMPIPTKALAKQLSDGAFKLLRTTEQGDAVVVTRDISVLGNPERQSAAKIRKLERDAERMVSGYSSEKGSNGATGYPVLTVSDVIETSEKDMPIVLELPTDSVIPVCAPGDNKNHVGYFIIVNEYGQPCRATTSFDTGITQEASNRLAMNAAKSVFGSKALNSFLSAGTQTQQMLEQMTQIFTVAVNHLLNSKMGKDGMTGLDIHVHEAIGKSIFYNLLAKNNIRLVFVPATMLIYYRFDHREDGTGKTFLEDIATILALRTTLTVAQIMTVIENSTKHRTLTVTIDDADTNPIETMNVARHSFVNKKTPVFTNDPMTAAENIVSRHLSVIPKGLIGNTDDLSVTSEQTNGNAQRPDDTLNDLLNNWVCQGLKLPPSALNQLNESEYSKSVSTTNLFFSNNVRNWQNIIHPYNSKFVLNYVLANGQMLKDIHEIVSKTVDGPSTTKVDKKDPNDQPDATVDPEAYKKTENILKQVLATIEIALPPPVMATNKTQMEELEAQISATEKLVTAIYPDDIAPNDEIKQLMSALRALISSDLIRDFLPKLGYHSIAAVPDITELNADRLTKLSQMLVNLKNQAEQVSKFSLGQIGTGNNDAPTGGPSSGEAPQDVGSDARAPENEEPFGGGDFKLS